jgi:hypothetical protein
MGNGTKAHLVRWKRLRRAPASAAFFLFVAVSAAHAQQPAGDPNDPSAPSALAARKPVSERETDTLPSAPNAQDGAPTQEKPASTRKINVAVPTHKFWDRENDLLFAAVGAGRALDYSSTLNLRRRGINEALLTNSIVDNHPLFAGIEVAATAASVGVSYIFHRTGHHRLERWTSAIHAGIAVGGAIRNYALPTPHP